MIHTVMTPDRAREILRGVHPGMSRRKALRALSAIVVLATADQALVGCAAFNSAVAIAPQLAADAELIAKAFQVIEPLLGFAGGAATTVNNLVNLISSTANQISTATTTTAASLVTTLGSAMGSLAGMVTGQAGVPALVSAAIAAGLALLPEFEAAFGITPAAAARRYGGIEAMTPEQARQALQNIVAGG